MIGLRGSGCFGWGMICHTRFGCVFHDGAVFPLLGGTSGRVWEFRWADDRLGFRLDEAVHQLAQVSSR